MHKNEQSNRSVFYAKILTFFSIALIISGVILGSDTKILDPVKDFTPINKDEEVVSVTPYDEEKDNSDKDNSDLADDSTTTSDSSNTKDSSSPGIDSDKKSPPSADAAPSSSPGDTSGHNESSSGGEELLTQARINDNLRNEIQDMYGITVRYGSETEGYSVFANGVKIDTVAIATDSVSYTALINLKNALSLYPNGFFQEIKQGGIPLTVLLISNYSEIGITGITDSSYSSATISIAVRYPFNESFFHESYHYIERYMFKKGAVFYNWDHLNPEGFTWGNNVVEYSYSNTKNPNSYFVNNYAQSSEEEDRASTFEYMMDSNKASCLNNGKPIWEKAVWMADNIDAVFDTVSPNVVEYWERYL